MPGGKEEAHSGSQGPDGWETTLVSHRQGLTQAMQWQPSQDVLAEGWWGGRMDSTPTWSVAPYLKMTHRRWRGATGFNFWQVRTHKHTHTHAHTHNPYTHTHPDTHRHKQTIPVVAKLRVCVTQFGLCVRRSCSLGATTSSYQFFSFSEWMGSKKKHKHTNQ